MLHLWVEKAGVRATNDQLEAALRRIGREDLLEQTINQQSSGVLNATLPGRRGLVPWFTVWWAWFTACRVWFTVWWAFRNVELFQ